VPGWDEADLGWTKDDAIWAGDPANWPDDAAAWPGGVELLSDDEPPTPEAILIAFDPDIGPPSASDSWPTPDDPADSANAQGAEPADPAERVPEAFAAGFTHRDVPRWGDKYVSPSQTGFAAGGHADTMPPGPVLARLAEDIWADGLAALNDDELIGVMSAARRLAARYAALEFAAVAELDRRRTAAVPDAADPRAAAHTSEELAAALVLTGRGADTLLDLSIGLARLPAVLAAQADGLIDRSRAVIFVDELAGLGDRDAVSVAATILPKAPDLTTSRLRVALRRAVLAFDPAAARRRRERAAARARVEAWDEHSGNSALAGRELSPAQVIAADRHITALARALKAAGAPGDFDHLRAAVFLALLCGRSPESLLPMPTCQPRPADPASAAPAAGLGFAWPTGPRGTVHLTMPLLAWAGMSDAPGMVNGLAAVDAFTCRDIATGLASQAATRWCLTITDADGRAIGHACTTAPPSATPPRSGGPATGPPGPGGPAGPGDSAGPAPPCTGPPDSGPPGSGPSDSGPPGGGLGGVVDWLAGLRIQWLETEDCAHPRESPGYRPGVRLRHLVMVRNPTCTAPGCRRPAQACDLDHTIPYEQGGRTCECDLGPLCRRHHRAKQAAGWLLEQVRPGVFTWTLPHGRSYTTRAEPYPL
jgi:hypothetical protein